MYQGEEEPGLNLVLVFLVAGFAPKTMQKFAEKNDRERRLAPAHSTGHGHVDDEADCECDEYPERRVHEFVQGLHASYFGCIG